MSRRTLAAATLLITACAWGATFTVVKNVLRSIAPEPFIFYRFTIAGVVLLLFAWMRGALDANVVRPGVILGFFFFAAYWLQTRGLMFISPSRSALLTGLYVVIVPLCDGVLYRVRVPLRAWSGCLLAMLGTASLIGGVDARPTIGDFLTLGCAVLFAFHVVLSARWSAQQSTTGLAAVQVLFVAFAAAVPAFLAPRAPATPAVVSVILFTAIVTTALAFVALMWGQAHVSATEAAVILSFEPVAAAFTSIFWDHEPVTLSFVIGAALILSAMIVSQLQR